MAPDQVPDRKGRQMSAVIEVTGLHKRYGGTVAVDDVSFAGADPEFEVVGEAADGAEAVRLARALQPGPADSR